MRSNFILIAAGFLLMSVPARATTLVYNNLSGSTSATSGGSAGITSARGGPLGDSFSTAGGPTSLLDVMLSLSASNPSDGNAVTVGLFANAGNKPGMLLGTLGTVADSALSATLSTIDVPVGSALSLAANTRYWIELSTTGSARWSYDAANVGVGVANEYNFYSGSSSANSSFTPYQMEVITSTAPTRSHRLCRCLRLGVQVLRFSAVGWRRPRLTPEARRGGLL